MRIDSLSRYGGGGKTPSMAANTLSELLFILLGSECNRAVEVELEVD